MSHYFSYVPNFDYISLLPDAKISEYIQVKNLFKRGKIKSDIFNNLSFFEKYSIQGDEKPYQLAQKFYGDPILDWVIFLSNNIINVEDEWPLPSNIFDKVMLDKYNSYENLYSGIHHYETNEIRDSLGNLILKSGLRVSPTWKTNGNFIEVINSKIQNIVVNGSIVSVYLQNEIEGLKVGSQITISNMSDNDYNGQHLIQTIITSNAFEIKLDEVPVNQNPTLADPRVEDVHLTLSSNSLLTANSYYYEFFDNGLGYTIHTPKSTFVRGVTNYEYELQRENKKRNIYLLKPEYIGVLLDDLARIMKYKKSSQYESPIVKRGDNSRLYN
jgi:hypothetical protein